MPGACRWHTGCGGRAGGAGSLRERLQRTAGHVRGSPGRGQTIRREGDRAIPGARWETPQSPGALSLDREELGPPQRCLDPRHRSESHCLNRTAPGTEPWLTQTRGSPQVDILAPDRQRPAGCRERYPRRGHDPQLRRTQTQHQGQSWWRNRPTAAT